MTSRTSCRSRRSRSSGQRRWRIGVQATLPRSWRSRRELVAGRASSGFAAATSTSRFAGMVGAGTLFFWALVARERSGARVRLLVTAAGATSSPIDAQALVALAATGVSVGTLRALSALGYVAIAGDVFLTTAPLARGRGDGSTPVSPCETRCSQTNSERTSTLGGVLLGRVRAI